MKTGWIRYNDYIDLEKLFWDTFCEEVGGLGKEVVLGAIKSARVLELG